MDVGLLECDAVTRLATQTGARQTAESTKNRTVTFKTRSGVQLCVYLHGGTVAAVVDHPRQGQMQIFKYGVDMSQLQDIFVDPLDTLGCGYRKVFPAQIPLGEEEETALRRHFEALESESGFIALEKAELRRRAAAAGYDITAIYAYGEGSDRKFVDGTNMSNLVNYRKTLSRSDATPHADSRRSSDSDADLKVQMGALLKQQSIVNAQLEEILLSKSKKTPTTTSSSSLQKSNSLTRSASLRRGQSTVGTKPGARAAPGDASGRADSDSPKRNFQTQKSVVNPNASVGSHVNAAFRQRGNQCCYALYKPEYHKEFGAAWSAKPANVVALGRGYVIIYDDGSVTWWDVPKLLDDKLKEQGASTQAVRYLALGSDENYYVKFVDGKMEWCGPDTFGDALKDGIQKSRLLVDKVAFGPNQGWLILWSDGTMEYERVPATLESLLKEKSSEQHVKDITVGPNDEWFVIFKDNSVRADNLPDSLYRILSEVQEAGGRVRQVIFGENSSWYVRYWDAKA